MFLCIIVTHNVLINILLVLAICEIQTEKVATSVTSNFNFHYKTL